MKKLYRTHNAPELVMTLIQLHCVGAATWMFRLSDSVVLRILFFEAGVLAAYMAWVFLFSMSGSRERANKAKEGGNA